VIEKVALRFTRSELRHSAIALAGRAEDLHDTADGGIIYRFVSGFGALDRRFARHRLSTSRQSTD
jgi:hypothetical protein